MKHPRTRTALLVVALSFLGAAVLGLRGGRALTQADHDEPGLRAMDPKQEQPLERVVDRLEAPAGSGSERVTANARSIAATASEGPSLDQESVAETLLRRLRGLAQAQGYHAFAWEAMEPASKALSDVEPSILLDELAKLERALLAADEGDLVRGACLIVMACAAPDRWFEERFSSIPVNSPEMERAGWLAFALRRRTEKGMEVVPALFPSWSKLGVYPIVVHRRACLVELEAARARLRELLPPELYENGGRGLPESKQEGFTREIVLLTVFGPGAAQESEEQEELLTLLTPQTNEQVFLKSAASFVLSFAARGSDDLARRVLRLASQDTTGTDRVDVLEFMAKHGGRPDLVVDALGDLYEEDGSEDIEVQLHQMIASKLIGDLLSSEDPDIRDAAFTMALDGSLDPGRNAHQRWLLLSTLDSVDHDTFLDALVLVLQSDTDTELLGLLSSSVRMLGEEDRTLASQLFTQLLGQESLPTETRRFVLGQLSMLGGQEAIDLLSMYAARELDDGLRRYAEELLDGLR